MQVKSILIGLVNIIVGIVEILLGLRLVLRLLGANPATDFVAWLYSATEPLLAPFKGIFPSPTIEQGSIFEFSTLFAIFIYALIAWLLKEIILFIADASRKPVKATETEYHEYHHHD